MKHRVAGRKLGETPHSARRCGAASSPSCFATTASARPTPRRGRWRGEAEHLITLAKRGSCRDGNQVHARRLAARTITDPEVTKRLFDEVGHAHGAAGRLYTYRQAWARGWAMAPRWWSGAGWRRWRPGSAGVRGRPGCTPLAYSWHMRCNAHSVRAGDRRLMMVPTSRVPVAEQRTALFRGRWRMRWRGYAAPVR